MIPRGRLDDLPIIGAEPSARLATTLFFSDEAERGVYNLTLESNLSEKVMINFKEKEYGISCEVVPFEEWRDALFEESGSAKVSYFTP